MKEITHTSLYSVLIDINYFENLITPFNKIIVIALALIIKNL